MITLMTIRVAVPKLVGPHVLRLTVVSCQAEAPKISSLPKPHLVPLHVHDNRPATVVAGAWIHVGVEQEVVTSQGL